MKGVHRLDEIQTSKHTICFSIILGKNLQIRNDTLVFYHNVLFALTIEGKNIGIYSFIQFN